MQCEYWNKSCHSSAVWNRQTLKRLRKGRRGQHDNKRMQERKEDQPRVELKNESNHWEILSRPWRIENRKWSSVIASCLSKHFQCVSGFFIFLRVNLCWEETGLEKWLNRNVVPNFLLKWCDGIMTGSAVRFRCFFTEREYAQWAVSIPT